MFPDPLTDAIFAYCVDVAAPSKFLQGTSNFCGNLADYLREHGFAVPAVRPQRKGPHPEPDFVDKHGWPRFVCECGTVVGLHEFGRHVDCEYYRHHCDACHERGACTAHDDEIDIEPGAVR